MAVSDVCALLRLLVVETLLLVDCEAALVVFALSELAALELSVPPPLLTGAAVADATVVALTTPLEQYQTPCTGSQSLRG